ncbi:MAG: helix-turn-helix domain-containing protein [Defluviitaleaceae bacterium]|nr:helix-turn-helix domain-containing protein [Defluviitaleaceae bacterium]
MVYDEFFANRLTSLRMKKGVSARDMSLSIGQSANYINKIEGKKTYPSMTVFFHICEYLGITPKTFFDTDSPNPAITSELQTHFNKLDEDSQGYFFGLIRKMSMLGKASR